MTFTLARGGARSDRHTTRHADQVEPPQTVMVGPTQAVRTTVLTDLKTRGVKDVFFVVCDGLKGLPDSVNAVFPKRSCKPA